VWVQFASTVVRLDIDVYLVEETRNEDVRRCMKDLDGCKCASGHDTGTVTWLSAPCNGLSFRVSDGAVRLWWAPQAEVYKISDREECPQQVQGSVCVVGLDPDTRVFSRLIVAEHHRMTHR
jgi:hypothetical protein